MAAGKLITISVGHDETATVWDKDDAIELRRTHRIAGSFVGSLPRKPWQNQVLSLPVLLMPQEVTLLLRKGYAVIKRFQPPPPPLPEKVLEFRKLREMSHLGQVKIFVRDRERKRKFIDQRVDRIDSCVSRTKTKLKRKSPLDEKSVKAKKVKHKNYMTDIDQINDIESNNGTPFLEDGSFGKDIEKIERQEAIIVSAVAPNAIVDKTHQIRSVKVAITSNDTFGKGHQQDIESVVNMKKFELMDGYCSLQDGVMGSNLVNRAQYIINGKNSNIDANHQTQTHGDTPRETKSIATVDHEFGDENNENHVSLQCKIRKVHELYSRDPTISRSCEKDQEISRNCEMDQENSRNCEMDLNISRNCGIDQEIKRKCEMDQEISRNCEMDQEISRNCEMDTKLSRNDQMDQKISKNCEMDPNISKNSEGNQQISKICLTTLNDISEADLKYYSKSSWIHLPTASVNYATSSTDQNIDWAFPVTTNEKLTYTVYQNLWEKGYFITTGEKFGCDFLVYPGEPARYHSHFIVIVLPASQKLSSMELLAYGRLGNGVKKKVVFAIVDENDDFSVLYKSLSWDGMQDSSKLE